MDIPVFVYDGIEFTNFEQIEEHEDTLILRTPLSWKTLTTAK